MKKKLIYYSDKLLIRKRAVIVRSSAVTRINYCKTHLSML